MSMANLDLDVFKDMPGYKGIVKAVLKYQIQLLVDQLSEQGGEESILLSANVSEATLSHLGTKAVKGFLLDNSGIKRAYLSYCLKKCQIEKRKAAFLDAETVEGVPPVKFIRAAPESSLNFPVHKKPSFYIQRRNTRIRSGSKQFSSSFSKGFGQLGGHKHGGRNIPTRGNVPSAGSESYGDISSYNKGLDDALNSQYEVISAANTTCDSERSDDQSQSVVVKTEIQNEDITTGGENIAKTSIHETESDVIVKVEPPDIIDEAGDKGPRVIPEDIQPVGDGQGHQYSPNVSPENEEFLSDGNQPFEYMLDQDNTDIITPWKPEDNERVSQFPSKRKQHLPTRIPKCGETVKAADMSNNTSGCAVTVSRNACSHGAYRQSPLSYGDKSTNQNTGNSNWIGATDDTRTSKNVGFSALPNTPLYKEKIHSDRQQTLGHASDTSSQRNAAYLGNTAQEYFYGRAEVPVWTQEQMSANTGPFDEKPGHSKGSDINWQEESFLQGGMKSYMKTPQVDGLFVSRGEGRYEKLIKCEECGKVCRTSNMARHKKRYCTSSPNVKRTKKNYSSANDHISMKDVPLDYSGNSSSIYVDNPERQGHCIDLTDSAMETNHPLIPKHPIARGQFSLDNDASVSHLEPLVHLTSIKSEHWNNQASVHSTNKNNYPETVKLKRDKFKRQTEGRPTTHLIDLDENELDAEMSQPDNDSGLNTKSQGVNQSNEGQIKSDSCMTPMASGSKSSIDSFDATESQLGDEIAATTQSSKENDVFMQDTVVKQEPGQ